MGASNSTPNLNLPQFADLDIPSWRGDVNGAFADLDSAHGGVVDQIAGLQTQVNDRYTKAESDGKFSTQDNLPINVAEQYGRNDAAVRAAVTAAVNSNRALHFAAGDFTVTGDLEISSPVTIHGEGYRTRITFADGALRFKGTSGFLMHANIHDIRIVRSGATVGPALHLKGAGNGTGVARFNAHNVYCSSPNGDGMLVEGSYIGFFFGCYFEASQTGIRGKIETTQNIVGANALTFLGGESNGNQNGWQFDRPSSVAFYGFTTEGNTVSGGKITGVARAFTYHGGYFELNNGPDIEVDCNSGSGGILIEGNVFYCVSTTKTESVLLRRGRVTVNHNHFNGLNESEGDVAIRVQEGTSPVFGEARNNMSMGATSGDLAPSVIAYTAGGAAFNLTQVGRVTKSSTNSVANTTTNEEGGIAFMRKVSQPVTGLGSIAANSEITFTIPVIGAVVGDDCSVSSSIIDAGLVIKSWGVTAADTVSVCLRNVTGAAVTASDRTWRVRVWR